MTSSSEGEGVGPKMTNDDRDEKKNQQTILANLQNSSLLQNDPIHGEVVLAPANQNR